MNFSSIGGGNATQSSASLGQSADQQIQADNFSRMIGGQNKSGSNASDTPAPNVDMSAEPAPPQPSGQFTNMSDFRQGGESDDRFVARGGNDTVLGGGGNDIIRGGAGNDILAGQDGNDTLRGGTGDDLLLGGRGDDIISGGRGTDTVGLVGKPSDYEIAVVPGENGGEDYIFTNVKTGETDRVRGDVEKVTFGNGPGDASGGTYDINNVPTITSIF